MIDAPPSVLPLDDAGEAQGRRHQAMRHGGLDAEARGERVPVVLPAAKEVLDEQEVPVDAGGPVGFRPYRQAVERGKRRIEEMSAYDGGDPDEA